MAFDAGYFSRSLDRRVDAHNQTFSRAIESMLAQMAAKGMLGSGATLRQMTEIAVRHLTEDFNSAAMVGFSSAEHHGPEVSDPLRRFADHICSDMVAYLTERGKNTGIAEPTVKQQLQSLVSALEARKEQLLDDFEHGILGDERMKKNDPVVSIVANQTGSPGAVQQIGVGDFSQNAFVENNRPLIAAIDEALASREFTALQPAQQDGFRDIAEVLKTELAKPSPDQGSLARSMARSREMSVSALIRHLLAREFAATTKNQEAAA
jgi:hypothetical protein